MRSPLTRLRTHGAPRVGRRDGRGGFTLLELTIVLLVSALVFLLAGALQSSYGHRSTELRSRADAVRELELAIDSLRADVGIAAMLNVLPGDELVIERRWDALNASGPPPQGQDNGLLYELVGADLTRTDREYGGDYVVATGLETFTVVRQGNDVVITLAAGRDDERKEVTLRWRP